MTGRSLRILVGAAVPPDPDKGAAGTVVHSNEALRDLGHEVDEIWADDLGRWIDHGNLHYLLELPFRYRNAVERRCRERDYDVIQLSQPYAWLAARHHRRSGRPGVFVNRSHGLELMVDRIVPEWHRRLGVPENRFPRSLGTAVLRSLLRPYSYWVARYADGLMVGARDAADFLVESVGVAEDEVAVVPHGLPAEFVQRPVRSSPLPERMDRILYVGQFSFIKGPHILASILDRLVRLRSGLSITWVCDGEDHASVMELLDERTRAHVDLRSWMAQEELLELYDSHGVFLFPSFYEGFGKAPLEAMARGMCVVASDVGGMRDLIDDGRNGRVVKVGEVDSFVEAALDLLRSPEHAADMGRSARQTAATLTWRDCTERAVQFYRRLLK